jgi:hypothetical protein
MSESFQRRSRKKSRVNKKYLDLFTLSYALLSAASGYESDSE